LFSQKSGANQAQAKENAALVFSEPVGDAVIPGGAVQTPDTETLKKYLMLREQDVAVLSNQLKAARDQITLLEKRLREEVGKNGDLDHDLSERQKRIEEFEKEKALALQGLQAEIDELRFQNKTKADKARLLESKVTEATEEIERLKERVRTDIRKIRVREKELENKLEIVRKDSEALITARETKIMELKRKIDLLEFNIDLLQDQNAREKENSAQLRERLAKAAQVVRVAGGLLDAQGKSIIEEAVSEKKGTREAS
jgi:chromosome segregation ATPase